jgi:AAA domain-containing protein
MMSGSFQMHAKNGHDHPAVHFADQVHFAELIEPVARRLLGEPNARFSNAREFRFGTHGSMSIDLKKRTWFDHENSIGGGVIALIHHKLGKSTDASAWLREEGFLSPKKTAVDPKPRLVRAYDYVDEAGELLFQVLRYEPKSFRQRQANGAWNLKGVRRVLYNLPGVIEAAANKYCICIVEGEEDVKILLANNIPATTCPGGAGKWRDEYNEVLRDADIILIADNDNPGREHVRQVAESLDGIAESISILDLAKVWPACPPKGDIRDWFKADGTAERLWELIDACPVWSPGQTAQDQQAGKIETWREGIITARDLCSKKFPELKFLVPGIISEGLTIAAGRPKIGKSWLLYSLGIAVANGVEALGINYGVAKPLKGNVLYLALEDGQRRLQRRMTKLIGINPENWPKELELKTEWRRLDQGGLDDIRAWEKLVKDRGGNPTLIMIDTLAKVQAPGSPKASPYQNDHDALAALQKLSDELGLFIILSHHDRKMDADDVFDTVSGTLGLTGAVDTILILTKKRDVRTLHVRGRDIEEDTSLEMKFGKEDCRWSVVGTLADQQAARVSSERTAILNVLAGADSEGLAVTEIMAATGSRNRNATDILLFKMREAGEIIRVKRGVYAHPETVGQKERKDGKKERNERQQIENTRVNGNLSDLSVLSDQSPFVTNGVDSHHSRPDEPLISHRDGHHPTDGNRRP